MTLIHRVPGCEVPIVLKCYVFQHLICLDILSVEKFILRAQFTSSFL